MSAVLGTINLRPRKGLAAYNAARAQAILTSERQAYRPARPIRLAVHRTARRPTAWRLLQAALVGEYGRRWWLVLIAAAIYFLGGTAASVLVIATLAGGQP